MENQAMTRCGACDKPCTPKFLHGDPKAKQNRCLCGAPIPPDWDMCCECNRRHLDEQKEAARELSERTGER
jgi:hypothetical protein